MLPYGFVSYFLWNNSLFINKMATFSSSKSQIFDIRASRSEHFELLEIHVIAAPRQAARDCWFCKNQLLPPPLYTREAFFGGASSSSI